MKIEKQVEILKLKFNLNDIQAYNIALNNNLMMFKHDHKQRTNDYNQSKIQA